MSPYPASGARHLAKPAGGRSALLLLFFAAAGLSAEPTPTGEPQPIEEVIVTATRLRHTGYDAPTPVTVLDASDLEIRGTSNLIDILNELPAFTATFTPSTTAVGTRNNGTSLLDLRGLGSNRNLVLVNGRRHVPFDEFGSVNINAIPQLAIDRVEVVTGGASAAWGSGAVSGVINIIYNRKLDGTRLNAQYGISGKGDAEESRLSLAHGMDIGAGRGHLLLAVDHIDNDGIPDSTQRVWQRRHPGLLTNPLDTGPDDGIPQFIIADNATLFIASPNGVTLPLGLPTDNLEFLPNGTAVSRELGIPGGTLMQGGSGAFLADRQATLVPLERRSLLAALDYQLSDSLNLEIEASASESRSRGGNVDAVANGVFILPDNPFLPADVAALGAPVILFRTFEEIPPVTTVSESENLRLVVGLDGDINENWWWDGYVQWGRGTFGNDQLHNLLVDNLALAADAVLDPASASIVCRANAGGANGAPGCVPINLFGRGSPSPAALDYVTATGTSDTEITQKVIAASISGQFDGGAAGPIQAALGAEYREEELDRRVDPNNEAMRFFVVNAQPLRGEIDAREVFGEVGIPLSKDRLDYNAAVRWTRYSTVGDVVSWKTGLTWLLANPLRFRASISQDVRAPSIGENFVESVLLFANINNPFTGNQDVIQNVGVGNLDLEEEQSITTTAGLVYSSPERDFQASADWYDIDIDDAIGQLTAQGIVDRCFAGNTDACDLVAFDSEMNVLEVVNKVLNLGTFDVRGVDFATRFATEFGRGTLGFDLLGTYVIEKRVAPMGDDPVDVTGELGRITAFGVPELRFRLGANYAIDDWSVHAQARYVGSGKYNPAWGPEQLAPDQNHIGPEVYFDLSGRYRIKLERLGQLELYAGVNNLLDQDPPRIPFDFVTNLATNPAHYDVVGRYYFAGLRWRP